jgi:hypothetical protein
VTTKIESLSQSPAKLQRRKEDHAHFPLRLCHFAGDIMTRALRYHESCVTTSLLSTVLREIPFRENVHHFPDAVLDQLDIEIDQ